MSRPPGVPEDFVCKPCSQCERPTWYPPGAEAAAHVAGIRFMVVCERAECMRAAVQLMNQAGEGGAGYSGTSTERIERAQTLYPHKNPVDALWDQAALQPGEVIDIGRLVACDDCGEDYTNSKVPGGFVWHGRATCPVCADRVLTVLPTQKLARLTQSAQMCPADMSFADFVRELRGPDATIKITRHEP